MPRFILATGYIQHVVGVCVNRIGMDRCKANLDAEMKARGWPVTFSVGVVEFQTPPANIDIALDYVDQVMYQAKREGKNRVIFEYKADRPIVIPS